MTHKATKRPLRVVADSNDRDALMLEWQATMRAANLRERTVTAWPGIICRASKAIDTPVTEFAALDLTYWLSSFATPNTRRTYFIALVGWHRWLLRTGRRTDDPMLAIRVPKVPRSSPRPVSTIGLHRVLESELTTRTRAMVLLAAYQGLRVHEIAKLRAEDVDLDDNVLRVVGKGGVSSELPLHPAVAEVTMAMPQRGWWFESMKGTGGPIVGKTVSSTIGNAMRDAGVRGVPHGFRHWYATTLLREGADVRTVQTLMRHASLATTQVYLEVADDTRRSAVLRLPGPRPSVDPPGR